MIYILKIVCEGQLVSDKHMSGGIRHFWQGLVLVLINQMLGIYWIVGDIFVVYSIIKTLFIEQMLKLEYKQFF